MAAKSIMKWVLAVVEYHEKSQIVKPKKIKLAQEEGRLAVATEELEGAQAELRKIKELLD